MLFDRRIGCFAGWIRLRPAQVPADVGQGQNQSPGMGTSQGTLLCPRPALAVVLFHRAHTRDLCAYILSTLNSLVLPTALTKREPDFIHLPMQYTRLFRRLREQKGLSHEALAKLAHCHRNTVLNAESGRPVKFKTIAGLMGKMGYATNSPEMASLALLWLESVSGLDLADPSTLGPARQKLAGYDRTTGQATQQLVEIVRRARLTERQIRLLCFAAQRPEMLAVIESIQDLMQSGGTAGLAELKVAEDK